MIYSRETTDFAYSLTRFLANYLPGQCNASTNTVLAYRDAFKLLIRFAETKRGMRPEKLMLAQIDKPFVEDFLTWLEFDRENSITTRNHRLAAIHSFFGYLQREQPDMMAQCQHILGIRFKKAPKPAVKYLPVDAVKALLAVPNATDPFGFRDAVMLGLLYDTGVRVSELTALRPMDFRLKPPAVVTVMGKGRKVRELPLSPTLANNTSVFLECWGLNTPDRSACPLFTNHMGHRIGRAGVAYILDKYIDVARKQTPELVWIDASPHTMRHSKAMHMVEARVGLIYIRDQLGHVYVKTTEGYARASPEMLRAELEKAAGQVASQIKPPSWTEDNDLMNFLNSLGR